MTDGRARDELSREQQSALDTAYGVFRDRGQWPTHQYVDGWLRRQFRVSLWDLLHTFPVDLLQQPPPFGQQDRVRVRVRGLTHCPNAAPDLYLFISAIQWLVRRRQEFQPDPTAYQDLQVSANEFRLQQFPPGHGPTDVEFTKVYELLMGEHLGLGGSPGDSAGAWELFVPAEILDLDGIFTPEQYVEYLDRKYPPRTPLTQEEQVAAIEALTSGVPPGMPTIQIPATAPSRVGPPRVFIVHGHDETAREDAHAYLQELGLVPVVLQDQPNLGRTIIEKVEENSDVDYAVVLVTPDDVGRKAGGESSEQTRARQNVIFELGFFIGKLGRRKVCVLYKPDTEIPSDLQGVGYVRLAGDSWKASLLRELRAAGVQVSGAD